jgi:hypothetical protein
MINLKETRVELRDLRLEDLITGSYFRFEEDGVLLRCDVYDGMGNVLCVALDDLAISQENPGRRVIPVDIHRISIEVEYL